jgi:arginyl-tRNA--protein-N-Asp/Glu arginylyltransferase
MQIHFHNNFGKFTQCDFAVTQVTATVSPDEETQALDQGFLKKQQTWRQCRSTRVQLAHTQYHMMAHARILTTWDHDQLMDINHKYLAHRSYQFHPADVQIHDTDTVWGYYHQGQLVAWSRIHNYQGARETAYFSWNSENMKLRLGTLSLQHEIAWAKSQGDHVLYLGPGYESCSKYKSAIPGFQWWTGTEWSTDTAQYCWLCDQDSAIQDFRDYQNLIYNAK